MRFRKLVVFVVMLAVLVVTTACGTDDSELIEGLQAQVASLQALNESLRQDMQNMSVTEIRPETSLRTVEGSNIPVFEHIDGKIVFPNALDLPTSSDDVNNSLIRVGSRFTFEPSGNWMMVMDGTSLSLSHPLKIWGSMKAISVKETPRQDAMQGILQDFYKGFPATTISYRKIFMSERVVGMVSKADITVDEEPYTINVGFVVRGENGILFIFAYQHESVGVQQELIDLLLSSGRVGDARIKLE